MSDEMADDSESAAQSLELERIKALALLDGLKENVLRAFACGEIEKAELQRPLEILLLAIDVLNLPPRPSPTEDANDLRRRIADALGVIRKYGGFDGAHHKQWVLDQVVRRLTRDGYAQWVTEQKDGEDGPGTYTWEEGIPP